MMNYNLLNLRNSVYNGIITVIIEAGEKCDPLAVPFTEKAKLLSKA